MFELSGKGAWHTLAVLSRRADSEGDRTGVCTKEVTPAGTCKVTQGPQSPDLEAQQESALKALAAVEQRVQEMTLKHAGEVRQLEGELAQSQQRVQELEAELGGAREAAAAAQRRVGVLEAEVTFYAGQAEQAGQELDGMQRELADAQQQCVQLEADLAQAEQAALPASQRGQGEDAADIWQLEADLHACILKVNAAELRAKLADAELTMLRAERLADGQEVADLRAGLVEAEQELDAERAAAAAVCAQLQQAQGLLAAQPDLARQLADARAALAHQQTVSQVLALLAQRGWVAAAGPPAAHPCGCEALSNGQAPGKAMLAGAPGGCCAGCIKAVHARHSGSACESPARSASSSSTVCLAQERASPEGTAQRCALPADVGVLAASLGALRLALAGGAHGFPAKGSPPRAEPVLALHAAASAAPAACEAGAAEAGAPAPPLPVRPRRRGRRLLRSMLAVPIVALVVVARNRSA